VSLDLQSKEQSCLVASSITPSPRSPTGLHPIASRRHTPSICSIHASDPPPPLPPLSGIRRVAGAGPAVEKRAAHCAPAMRDLPPLPLVRVGSAAATTPLAPTIAAWSQVGHTAGHCASFSDAMPCHAMPDVLAIGHAESRLALHSVSTS